MANNKRELEQRLQAILPEASSPEAVPSAPSAARAAEQIVSDTRAKARARIIYKEKQKLKSLQEKQGLRQELQDSLGLDPEALPLDGLSPGKARAIKEQEEKIRQLEAIERDIEREKAFDVKELAGASSPNEYSGRVQAALKAQGASRPELQKLFAQLGVNLSVRLSRSDTANLLAAVLTCNEAQLDTLLRNKKLPLAFKIIIKRLMDDARLGNTDLVERLWDKLFGKANLALEAPGGDLPEPGLLPGMPVSREAYILIREQLIK